MNNRQLHLDELENNKLLAKKLAKSHPELNLSEKEWEENLNVVHYAMVDEKANELVTEGVSRVMNEAKEKPYHRDIEHYKSVLSVVYNELEQEAQKNTPLKWKWCYLARS